MMKNSSLMMESRPGFYQEDNPSSRFGIGIGVVGPSSSSSATTTSNTNSSSGEHQQQPQLSFPLSYYSHHQPPRGPTALSSRDAEFMRTYSGSGGGGGPNYTTSQLLPPEHLLLMRSSSSPSTSHGNNPVNVSDNIQDSDQVGPSGSGGGGRGGGGGGMVAAVVEREHMFDKVVTPSDVGKLNRLVIPKQHAEKYFPLDSSTNEKGLLLNFEDRNGKPWRFRYSYWNSSQSYVMTKGWSRFVKEKKLDAGDIVSFQRGLGCKDRLFIDWRRRPDYAAASPPPHHFPLPPLPRLYHHPSIITTTPSFNQSFTNPHQQFAFQYPTTWTHHHNQHPHYLQQHHQQLSSQNNSFSHHFQQELQNSRTGYGNPIIYLGRPPGTGIGGGSGSGSAQVIRGMTAAAARGDEDVDDDEEDEDGGNGGGGGGGGMVYESVPVVQGKATAKRLRLFGVNMDCPISTVTQEDEELIDRYSSHHHHNYPEILALNPHSSPIADSSRFTSSSSGSPLVIRPYIDGIDAVSDNTVNGTPTLMPAGGSSSSNSGKGKGAANSSSSMSLDLDI